MPRKEQHVVPNSDGGWDVKKGGAERASKHFDRKSDAEKYGKELAKKQGAEYIPHGKDGKIQNPNSYGNDPMPPRDKRH